MNNSARDRGFRVSRTLAALAGAWAMAVALTGGFAIDFPFIHLSSRNPRNATILAVVSAAIAWVLAPAFRRRQWLTTIRSRTVAVCEGVLSWVNGVSPRVAPVVAGAASVTILMIGLLKGAQVAAGSDGYGYASQADLWVHGMLRVEQPLMDQMTWPVARQAMAPLGYRPAVQGAAIVPVYGPGLPMLMAVFAWVAGRPAVFYVVPALGGLAIWATYLMGRRLAGRVVGVVAAILLATSPVFLFQLVQPMSDVPAACWWALTLALLLFASPAAAFTAGLSAGAAILTRANLAPLLGVIGAFLVWNATSRLAVRRAMLFAAGAVPGCATAAVLNAIWYGSAFKSGYGSFDYLYQAANLWPNVTRYPRWLLESQTPIVVLAIVAPFLLPRTAVSSETAGQPRKTAVMWLAFISAVLACYVFYAPFDAWWYLRFLLPAFGPLAVLTAVGIVSISTRVAGRARLLAVAAVVAVLGWHGVRYAIDHSTFMMKRGEQKYAAVGNYIATRMPERAVFLSIQHSGSARYYSGRLTIRFDWIDPKWLDRALDDLRSRGYHPYFLLEEFEEPQFRERFAADSPLGALNWPPIARLPRTPDVKIYDPAQAEHAAGGRQTAIDIIPE
jgi:Dolichyl-phosphate-mannose-protein mannosyltransferase